MFRQTMDLPPRQALAFDLTVMRAHDHYKRLQYQLHMQQAQNQDEMGIGRVLLTLGAAYLEG